MGYSVSAVTGEASKTKTTKSFAWCKLKMTNVWKSKLKNPMELFIVKAAVENQNIDQNEREQTKNSGCWERKIWPRLT